jgi:cobyrinic acid a,c-diamide synthase
VVANGVAGDYHRNLHSAGLSAATPLLASLAQDTGIALPERQLGLVHTAEIADLEQRLEAAARAFTGQPLAELPAPVAFTASDAKPLAPSLRGVRLAVARDAAFCFVYQANLDLLQALGAELRYFSPLTDQSLPEADSLYLPGGQPELHLPALAANTTLLAAIRDHHAAGRPVLAEGGGLLYLLESLTDASGQRYPLVGALPGHGRIGSRLRAVGPQCLVLPEGELRGNSFHYATIETAAAVIAHGSCPNGGPVAEPVYRQGRLTASSTQLYFPANAAASAELLLP